MSKLKLFEWDKKRKTSLRNIKVGDVFCFALSDGRYGVGRIMTRNSLGHVAEIFTEVLDSPSIVSVPSQRLGSPIILDSYSLFDRKAEGDWRVIAHEEGYEPSAEEAVRFVYGVANNTKLVDIFDNETSLSGGRSEYPSYSPMGDEDIKELLGM